MGLGIPKARRHESRAFLAFAKRQHGNCCLCWPNFHSGEELHHFGEKGMGQKGHDYLVARVCHDHHEEVQGKRKHAFAREGNADLLIRMQADALELLMAWAAHLEGGGK